MAKSVSELVKQAQNYSPKVEIKEAGGQAAVVVYCTEAFRTSLGVKQVDGTLEEAIYEAYARAIAAFTEEDVIVNEPVNVSAGLEAASEDHADGADDVVSDISVSEDTQPKAHDEIMVVPDDILAIPDDIPEEVLEAEILEPEAPASTVETEAVCELPSTEETPAEVEAKPKTRSRGRNKTETKAEAGSEAPADANEADKPEGQTEGSPLADPDDFEFSIGPHKAAPIMASAMVKLIKAGDAKEIKAYNALKVASEFMKTRGSNDKIAEQIDRLLRFAAEHGVQ